MENRLTFKFHGKLTSAPSAVSLVVSQRSVFPAGGFHFKCYWQAAKAGNDEEATNKH